MKSLISINQVSLQRGDKWVLKNISLDIHQNQIITLIGPNGAGKTSLVNIILGLIKADSGEVERKPGIRFGYMPQKLVLDPTMPLSALRFLQLTQADARLCLQSMEKTAIAHLAKTPVQALSGGEMQRLLLAKAILRKPDLLVLDEPVQGVDVMGQESLYRLISELRNELHCAVLMVSHDLHLVMSTTDQVICLNQHICCHGSPDKVAIDPEFTALFGSKTALYNHHHDHKHDMHGNVLDSASGACRHD